jgi:hypothetical protein
VTALTRADSTSKMEDGVKIVHIDYNDEASLVAALQGQQCLIITMSVFAPPDTQAKLIEAAGKAGVGLVLPNCWGGDPNNEVFYNTSPLGIASKAARGLVERVGSSWVALSSGFWYEFSLAGGPDRYGFDITKRTFKIFDDGMERMNTTTWPQCGKAVAGLLSLKELPVDESDKEPTIAQFRNQVAYVSSFRISQMDMFESVKRVTGTTDADWSISKEPSSTRFIEARSALAKGDMRAFGRYLYTRAFFPTGDSDYESRRGLHNDLLGLPVEDLDEATKEGVRMAEAKEVPF